MSDLHHTHKMLGEYIYDGIPLCGVFPKENVDRIKNGEFKPREEDVMVISYPKAGNSWFQEIIWLLMNDADVTTASSTQQEDRVIFLEWVDPGEVPRMDLLKDRESPQVIKSHLPYTVLEHVLKNSKTKLVFGIRNVKDTLVSLYHFYCMNKGLGCFPGTFDEFFEMFKEKRLIYGDWFDMNLTYWNNKETMNMFLLRYEDLHKDLSGTIHKLADFLGKDLTEEQYAAIIDHVSFDSMRANDNINKKHVGVMDNSVSPYMRRGKVGDWQSHLSPEQNEYIDKLYAEKIVGTGLEVDFTM